MLLDVTDDAPRRHISANDVNLMLHSLSMLNHQTAVHSMHVPRSAWGLAVFALMVTQPALASAASSSSSWTSSMRSAVQASLVKIRSAPSMFVSSVAVEVSEAYEPSSWASLGLCMTVSDRRSDRAWTV